MLELEKLEIQDSSIIALEEKARKYSLARHSKRILVIKEKWDEIIAAVEKLVPATQEIEALLKSGGAPINPKQVGIDGETVERWGQRDGVTERWGQA